MAKKIAYILGCFPNNTPTFVFNEMKELDRLGLGITIFSIHKSCNNKNHLDYKTWLPKIVYAPSPYSPPTVASHLYFVFMRPLIYFKLLFQYKEFGGKRVFWEGVYFSRIIQKMEIRHVHAHFAWKAADCARLIKSLTGIPFSFTAHQSDIHRSPERLFEKLSEAKFIFTCTRGNKEYLGHKYGEKVSAKTFTVYHGVDVDKFLPKVGEDGEEIDILSIGNLIKVKGFEYLIKACVVLKGNNLFKKCVIVGEGEEKDNLESLINQMELKDRIEIRDTVTYDEVVNLYKRAKIFVLPVTVINGAPHGIPNVIAEAMAMRLAVITSNVPNIPELIENEKDGFLVPDKDPQAIALVINQLLSNEKLRELIGKNARLKIKNKFNFNEKTKILKGIFEELTK